jgi:hypothetical protein
MVTFTLAKNLTEVAPSSYVGNWDEPTNANWSVVDAALGQSVSIALSAASVSLSQAQMQCAWIIFTGTLTASVSITFPQVGSPPASITGSYTIFNNCAGSSAYSVTLKTTVAGSRAIGAIPGNAFDCVTDGTHFRYRNLPPVGSYMDHATGGYPTWVSACTVQLPYLYCDGSAFNTTQYPILAGIIGGTLPDCRGRARYSMDGGTGRLPLNAGVGPYTINGNSLFAGGGIYYHYIVNGEVPELSVYDPSHTHLLVTVPHGVYAAGAGGGGGGFVTDEANYDTSYQGTGLRPGQLGGNVPFSLQPPSMTQGLTFIRSA